MPEQYPRAPMDAGGVRVDNGGTILAIIGAVVGSVVAYFLFYYLAKNHGIAALALPSAGPGLGRVAFTRSPSWLAAGVCLGLGVGVGLFVANDFFANGIAGMNTFAWAGLVVGALISLWFGKGRKINT